MCKACWDDLNDDYRYMVKQALIDDMVRSTNDDLELANDLPEGLRQDVQSDLISDLGYELALMQDNDPDYDEDEDEDLDEALRELIQLVGEPCDNPECPWC